MDLRLTPRRSEKDSFSVPTANSIKSCSRSVCGVFAQNPKLETQSPNPEPRHLHHQINRGGGVPNPIHPCKLTRPPPHSLVFWGRRALVERSVTAREPQAGDRAGLQAGLPSRQAQAESAVVTVYPKPQHCPRTFEAPWERPWRPQALTPVC